MKESRYEVCLAESGLPKIRKPTFRRRAAGPENRASLSRSSMLRKVERAVLGDGLVEHGISFWQGPR